ncbi:MAG: class I SAM-dependent methyltransferase [Candidatus Thiodiazotropha taylori]|nr:class I SAM-dependent methyltransferase [Candidatus Thiodiazotropha taylori]MCG8092556.1 class I SAM-dependent methyltransferase [Candidatus Thiodiazotropha endolucinida]MCG7880871.1 class I SAM-dependent methyltransferase [Candidatus Thiodiazotropha taylori]MCG7887062.1 class I SAM-dependent methyltransferase [Candidatus Thiodiazotropha taylori]MCG7889088.1 class I SAM-dependent methyltransferase [Candidatus Thiodiazotropha taylori]
MKLLNQTKKIPRYIRENGIASLVIYLMTTTLLTGLSWLLIPFKKKINTDSFYQVFNHFIESVNDMEQATLLEIGSRNVTGVVWREVFSPTVEYTGMDIHPGENVDVVGDVHTLSSLLPGEHYDAVFSVSVFEHLAMPWKAVLEINRVMKPGGLLYISTHPAIPPHELPWDFWRFSGETFKILLNESTGFEILESQEGTPGRILSLSRDHTTANTHRFPINQSIAILARKTGAPDPGLSWDIPVSSLLQTDYPK